MNDNREEVVGLVKAALVPENGRRLTKGGWGEADHPREEGGRFGEGGGDNKAALNNEGYKARKSSDAADNASKRANASGSARDHREAFKAHTEAAGLHRQAAKAAADKATTDANLVSAAKHDDKAQHHYKMANS